MTDINGLTLKLVRSWAARNNIVLCDKDAFIKMMTMLNDLALGSWAEVTETGNVLLKFDDRFDYKELTGLKLLIETDKRFLKSENKEDDCDDTY